MSMCHTYCAISILVVYLVEGQGKVRQLDLHPKADLKCFLIFYQHRL